MRRRARLLILALALSACVVAGVVMSARECPGRRGARAAEVEMVPSAQDSLGVDVAAHFVVTCREPAGETEVAAGLRVSPPFDYRVEEVGSGGERFRIVPREALAAGKVYRFELSLPGRSRAYRWSFQTKTSFRVVGTLPRDEAVHVPVNSGVEIIFSHENFQDPAGYLEITPAVGGRLERHKKTLVFVPSRLEYATIYTVKLSGGLGLVGSAETLAEDCVFSFETEPRPEPQADRPRLEIPDSLWEFPPGREPFLQVYIHNTRAGQPVVSTSVYRYPEAAAFVAALSRRDGMPWWAPCAMGAYREDTSGLPRVARFDAAVGQMPDSTQVVVFPEALPAGYYLAEFTLGEVTRQAWMQVTDVAWYAAMDMDRTLVWLNDIGSGGPCGGATLRMMREEAAVERRADDQGVVLFPTPRAAAGEQYTYFLATAGHKEAVIRVPLSRSYFDYFCRTEDKRLNYWRYLYLDRSLYKPDDTVQFWGIVKPREGGALPLASATVDLCSWAYSRYGSAKPVCLASQVLPTRGDTFTGSFVLPHLQPGTYFVRVTAADVQLVQTWFEVQTYTKPAYALKATTDRVAVFAGEEVRFEATASFFEGTPVVGLPLTFSFPERTDQAKTDSRGRMTATYTPAYQADCLWLERDDWLRVFSSLPEAGEIGATAPVRVFNNDIRLRAESRGEEGRATIWLELRQVVLDRLNRQGGRPDDYLGPPVKGHRVAGDIYELWWVAEEAGDYYDFIDKVVRKKYHYRQESKLVDRFEVVTDANGEARHAFAVDEDKSYQVKLRASDLRGNLAHAELYLRGRARAEPEWAYTYYRLEFAGPQDKRYAVGETVRASMLKNDAPLSERRGGYLFYLSRRGIREYRVQDGPDFSFPFLEEYVPTVYVTGVFFDGREYRRAYTRSAVFDRERKALAVEVKTDREAYSPGDTVSATVKVADLAGKPARAIVNLSLVDEALFRLREQHVDLLAGLYGQYVPDGVAWTFFSHQRRLFPGGGAEQGGEGEGGRTDFRDAAFFSTVATGEDGRAQVSIKLPDNLTSWRLTYQAVTDDVRAASGTAFVRVRLPFFAEVVMSETYLEGDRPVIAVRAYGESLQEGEKVEFAVAVKGPDGSGQETALVGRAFEPAPLQLPELAAGGYAVTVNARAGPEKRDSLTRSFVAEGSYLVKREVDYYLLDEETRIKGPEKGLVALTFADAARGQYLRALRGLSCAFGDRLEQRLARTVSHDLLKQYFGVEAPGGEEVDVARYQAPDGGMGILPYAASDLELSVLAAVAAADRLDRAALGRYFYKLLEDPQEERGRSIAALCGLAALDEPVLDVVNRLLGERDLEPVAKLYLALACALLGHEEQARSTLDAVFKEGGQVFGPYARLTIGRDRDEMIKATALAALTAAATGWGERDRLFRYLVENRPLETVDHLEMLAFLRSALPGMPGEPVSFSVFLEGQEKRCSLGPKEAYTLAVSAGQLSDLKFAGIQGRVAVSVSYEAPLYLAEAKNLGTVRVTRRYLVNDRPTTVFSSGDLVLVEITCSPEETAPAGLYEIADFLPSGLKLVCRPWERGLQEKALSYPAQVSGQRAVFHLHLGAWGRGREQEQSNTIRYYARVVSAGDYRAEPAIAQQPCTGELMGLSQDARVQIR